METNKEHEELRRADLLCTHWRSCLESATGTKPLSRAWLPEQSPFSNQPGPKRGDPGNSAPEADWWSWTPENPAVLFDRATGRELPDEFPYRNHAASCAYRHVLSPRQELLMLETAWKTTGRTNYLRTAIEILKVFSNMYSGIPLSSEHDANTIELVTRSEKSLAQRLQRFGAQSWEETLCLQYWLTLYELCCSELEIDAETDNNVQSLAQAVMETDSLPPALYFLDKYHNSMTNYYEAFIRSASIWGTKLSVRDLLTGNIYSGGDLVQLAVNGPVGIRSFVFNAFDRNGVYWELSGSYTGYSLGYLRKVMEIVSGYSDPENYRPGDAVEAFYKPISNFSPAKEFPTLWRAVVAQSMLSQVNLLFPPTNDTNYLNGPNPEQIDTWAKLLDSDRLRKTAEEIRAVNGQTCPRFPAADTTLAPAAGAVTARGPGRRMDFHLDWHRMQDYHSHQDPLNFVVGADGYLVLTDLGYHLGTPLRHLVSDRTAAHNTVTVDRQDSRHHGKGTLHHLIANGPVKMAEASVPDAYPQCSLYRRTVVLVDDRYVIDLFRVEGGSQHDYALLSRADKSDCNLDMTQHPGTVANPDEPWAGFDHMDISESTTVNPCELMHHPRFGNLEGNVRLDWPQRDRPDLTTRVHHAGSAGTKLILASIPHADRRQPGRPVLDDQILVTRRTGKPGLTSTFLSVIECLNGKVEPLTGVEKLAVESNDPWAAAVRIRHEHGHDIAVFKLQDGMVRIPELEITFTGGFAMMRHGKDGAIVSAHIHGGRLTAGKLDLAAPETQSARVTSVDTESGGVELSHPLSKLPSPPFFVSVLNETGTAERWLVRDVNGNGDVLHMDTDHSEMICARGVIERVENDRVFVTTLRLSADLPEGTILRIGPIGDFGSQRHIIETFSRTQFPLRMGGTVVDGLTREIYVGLDRHAKLTPDLAGTPFWINGVETGDTVCTEPVAEFKEG